MLEEELRQREAAESERVAREERDEREAADAVAKAEQARQLGNAEAERAIEEQRAREVAIAERAARADRERREAQEAAEKAEQARKLAEVEAARRAAEERRAAETSEADRTKRAQAEPEKKTEVEQRRPEAMAAVARALFEPASAVPAPPSRPALSELSAKAVRPSGLNKVIVASIVGALAVLAAALLTTHFESPPNVPATTTARTVETSRPAPNAPSSAQAQHTTSENCFGETNCFTRIGPETQGVPPTSTAPSTPTTPQTQYSDYYRDHQQAYYRKLADQGNANAQFMLGNLYEEGRNFSEAKGWYQKAADQGYEPARDALKRLIASDTPTASTTETKPNAPTTAQGQYVMGSHYEYGYGGVTVNYPQAAYWYRQAADQGYADAQFNLGWLYENGLGVGKDNDRAKVWYQKAADQGNLGAQSGLQRLQSQQNPSERTASSSPSPITTPQEQGLTPAEENERGDRYFYGRGVDQDYVKAMEWYRKAADQGLADGQYNVGVLYENGWGVTKDIDQAKVWYQKSADQGDGFARVRRQRLQEASASSGPPGAGTMSNSAPDFAGDWIELNPRNPDHPFKLRIDQNGSQITVFGRTMEIVNGVAKRTVPQGCGPQFQKPGYDYSGPDHAGPNTLTLSLADSDVTLVYEIIVDWIAPCDGHAKGLERTEYRLKRSAESSSQVQVASSPAAAPQAIQPCNGPPYCGFPLKQISGSTHFASELDSASGGGCLDVPLPAPPDASRGNNVWSLRLSACAHAPAYGGSQRWFVFPGDAGNYVIHLQQVDSYCLDLPWGATLSGTRVQLFPCHGHINQQWLITMVDKLTAEIKPAANPGMCVQAEGEAASAPVLLRPCQGSIHQRWLFRSIAVWR